MPDPKLKLTKKQATKNIAKSSNTAMTMPTSSTKPSYSSETWDAPKPKKYKSKKEIDKARKNKKPKKVNYAKIKGGNTLKGTCHQGTCGRPNTTTYKTN